MSEKSPESSRSTTSSKSPSSARSQRSEKSPTSARSQRSEKSPTSARSEKSEGGETSARSQRSEKGGSSSRTHTTEKGDSSSRTHSSTEKGGSSSRTHASEKGDSSSRTHASEKGGSSSRTHSTEKGGSSSRTHASEKGGSSSRTSSTEKGGSSSRTHHSKDKGSTSSRSNKSSSPKSSRGTKASLVTNEKKPGDITIEEFDYHNPDHAANLKDQLKRLRNQQIQILQLMHEAMKKNEVDNDARMDRHTDTYRKAVLALQKGENDQAEVKKKLDELKGMQESENAAAQDKQKTEFYELDVLLQRKLKDMEDISNALVKNDPAYKGELSASKVDRQNASHVKYVREQLSRLREEELSAQQLLFSLRSKQQVAMDKLTIEQNEKFARILNALLKTTLSDDVQASKIDQMKSMLVKDREAILKKHRGEFFTTETDGQKTVKKIIEYEKSISSDNPESPNALIPVRRVPSTILLAASASTGSETSRGGSSTSRSLAPDKGNDIALAEFDPKNPDHVTNLKHQLKKLRVHELQLHQKIHEVMRKNEEDNDQLLATHEELFSDLVTKLESPDVGEDQIKVKIDELNTRVDQENESTWKKQKAELGDLSQALQKKLKEITDIETALFKGDQTIKENLEAANIDRENRGHMKWARHQLGKLKKEELALQEQMGELRAKHQSDYESLVDQNNDTLAQMLAQMKRGNKKEDQISEKLDQMKKQQNKAKNDLFKKQKDEFSELEGKLKQIFERIIEYERAISSNNMRSLTALFPLRRVPSDIIRKSKAVGGDDYIANEVDDDDADTQLRKLTIRRFRQEELKFEDRVYDAFRKQEKYNGHVEQDQSSEIMKLISELLVNKETEEEIKVQFDKLKKMIEDDNLVISKRQEQEFKQLQVDVKKRVHDIEKLEDEIMEGIAPTDGKLKLENFDRGSRSHVYNLQKQIRLLRGEEFILQAKLNDIRARQWEENRKMFVEHYDRFGKIQRGLTKAKLSDDAVNSKSTQMRDVLEKDKDTTFAKQKEEYYRTESELIGVMQQIVEIEKVIQTSTNVNTRFSYDPPRKVPQTVEIVRPSAIQFVSYVGQKELVSREVPAPKIDFDKVGDQYRRVRTLRQEELAIEYRIHIAMQAHEKYNGYISRQQNRKYMRTEGEMLKQNKNADEIKRKLDLLRKEFDNENYVARENQKEEIEQLKSELKVKIKEIAEVEKEFGKNTPVVASNVTLAKFDKKNPAHIYNLQEQLQEMRDDYLDQEVKLFELRVGQQKTNQKMTGDLNEKFATSHVQLSISRTPEKEVIDRCEKTRTNYESEKDTEFSKQQKDFAAVEDPLHKKARQMQDFEKALQTASDEFWYAYFPSRKIPGSIDLIRPGGIAYDPLGKGDRFTDDEAEDDEIREYDQLYRRPPPDSPEVQLKKLRLKGMRTEELELINKMHMALKNQEKYNAAIGKRHSEEFLKMLTSEMNRPDQTEAEMRAKTEEWKKVFDDENHVIADNQNREYNELVDSFKAKIKQISDLEDELSKGIAPMDKVLPLNRFDVNSQSHVYNLQQQLQKFRQEVHGHEKNIHDLRMNQQAKNQEMANNHNEKFALLQQGLVETGLNEEEVKERSEQMRNVLEKEKDKLHDKQREEFVKIEEKLREKLKQMMEIEKTIQTSNCNTRFTYEPVRRVVSRIWLIRPAESSYDPYGLRQNQDEVIGEADFNELDKVYGRKFMPGTRKKEKDAERAALAEQVKKMSDLNQRFFEVRNEELSLDDKLFKVFRSQERYNAHLLREQNKDFINQQGVLLNTEKNEEQYGKKMDAINWTFDVENKLVKRNMEDEINSVLTEKQKKLKELALVENELFKGAPAVSGDIALSRFDKKNPSHAANIQRQLQDLRIETIEYWKALFDVRLRQQEQAQKLDQETNIKFGGLQLGLKKATMNDDVLKGKSELLRDKLDTTKDDLYKTQSQEFRDLEVQIRNKYKQMGDLENALKSVNKEMTVLYSPVHKLPDEQQLLHVPRIGYDPFEKFRDNEEDVFDDEEDDDGEEGSVIRRKSAKVRFEALEQIYKKSLPPLPDTADTQLLKIQLKKQRTDELELLDRIHLAMKNQEKYNSIVALNQCEEFMRAQSDMLVEEETEEVILKTNAEIKSQFTENNAAIRENERKEVDDLEQSLRRKLREIANIENALNKNVPIFDEPINLETYNKLNSAHVYNLQLQVQGMREEVVTLNRKLHNTRMGHVAKNQALYGEHVEQFAMLQNGLSKAGLTNDTIKEKSDEMKATLEKEQNRIHDKQKDEFESIESRLNKKVRLLAQYEVAIGDSQTNTKFAYEPPRRVPSRIVLAPPVGIQYDVLYNKAPDDDDEDAIKDFDELNKIYGLKNKVKLPKSQKKQKEEEAGATTARDKKDGSATSRSFKPPPPEEDPEANFTHLGEEGDETYNFKIRKNEAPKEVPEDSKEIQLLKSQLKSVRKQELDLEDELNEILKKQEDYNTNVENEQSDAFLQLKNTLMQTIDDEEDIKRQLVELLQTFDEDNHNIKAGQQQEFDDQLFKVSAKIKEMNDIEDELAKGAIPLHSPPKDNVYDLYNPGHIVYLTQQMQQMRQDLLDLFKAVANSRFQHIDSNQKLFADFNLKFYVVHDALMGSRLSDEVLKTKLSEMKNELEIDKGKMHEYFVEDFSLCEIRLHKRMKDISNLEAAIGEYNKYTKFAYEPPRRIPGKIMLTRPTEISYAPFNRPAQFDEGHDKDFQELDKMYGLK